MAVGQGMAGVWHHPWQDRAPRVWRGSCRSGWHTHTHTASSFAPGCVSLCLHHPHAQSCPTLCKPMDCSTPGLPVHHQVLESPSSLPRTAPSASSPLGPSPQGAHPQPSPPPPMHLPHCSTNPASDRTGNSVTLSSSRRSSCWSAPGHPFLPSP